MGDPLAQHELYNRYVNAMYHTIIRMVGSREDAEDITQEVFVKVFQKLDSFRNEATLGAWIKRIAVNAALNFLRRQQDFFTDPVDEGKTGESEPEIDETEWANNLALIHEGIKKLPAGCRTVLNLYLLEDYTHREVADMLGISESTSKTQYKRARRLLREMLTGQ